MLLYFNFYLGQVTPWLEPVILFSRIDGGFLGCNILCIYIIFACFWEKLMFELKEIFLLLCRDLMSWTKPSCLNDTALIFLLLIKPITFLSKLWFTLVFGLLLKACFLTTLHDLRRRLSTVGDTGDMVRVLLLLPYSNKFFFTGSTLEADVMFVIFPVGRASTEIKVGYVY